MLRVLRFELPSELPIVGIELNPKLLISLPTATSPITDLPASDPVDGLFLSYKWYRVEGDKNAKPCHVHPSEPSTLQCQYCANRKSLIAKSYHCCSKCYQDAWQLHKELHEKYNEKADLINNYNPYGATFYPPRQESEVGNSRAYTPTTEDVGFVLRLEVFVVSAETKKVLKSAASASTTYRVVASPIPIFRSLVSVNEVGVTGQPGSFTVLSYNILSDTSASSSMYSYCPPWARTWTYRRLSLLKEIVRYSADIICLQEVQNDHLEDFFAPELNKLGYDVCYKMRTNEAQSREGSTIDGCATFYKRERFSFVKKDEIEFNKAAQALVEAVVPSNNRQLASRRLLQDNIALIVFLELKFGNVRSKKRHLICVANTRFDVQEDMKDVMLWHVHTLLKGMDKIAETCNDMPIIMCGDFNMVPRSAPHTLVVMGNVDQSHQDPSIDPFRILQPITKLRHQLPLVSAYSAFSRLQSIARLDKLREKIHHDSKEPLVTVCTKERKACHDYIFFTGHALRMEGVMELVDCKALCKETAIPSASWSSSHIALLARFSCRS